MKPLEYYNSRYSQSEFMRDLFRELGWDKFTTKQQTALYTYVYENTNHTYQEMLEFAKDLDTLVDILTN